MSLRPMLPSVETKPTICRKPLRDLLTLRPCRWTACGSDGIASCSLFCTCTCAMSGSVELSKVSEIVAPPLASLLDEM